MKSPFPKRTPALLASLLLAQWAAVAPAVAGPETAVGSALHPAPVNPSTAGRWMDEEGLGTRIPAARSPTGLLYHIPLDPGLDPEDRKNDAWWTTLFLELGGLHTSGDDRSQGFRNYQDLGSGFYLNSFGIAAERISDARYVEAVGGAVGRDDQFYRLEAGRRNDWKVTAFYKETPSVSTTTYRSLWSGVGTGDARLLGLTPGGTANANTTRANVEQAIAATEPSDLEVIRKKAGVRVDVKLGEAWKAYALLTDERREGARPFGAVFGGGGGGGNVEIAEAIDYETFDLSGGLQYADPLNSFNLRASASFFRNAIDTMSFENPLYISLNGSSGLSPTTFTQGRFVLPPDNEHYNLKGEYSRAFPDFHKANLTATVAFGSTRQDDALYAPTQYPLTGGRVTDGGVSLANNWNTTDALTRSSADSRIDTRLADLALTVKPAGALDVKGKLRYYETRNDSGYLSCNPLTGQWGRLLNDGSGLSLVAAHSGAGVNPAGTSPNAFNAVRCDLAAAQALGLVPSAGNIPIASAPFDHRQLNGSVFADWRFARASSVNATVEREALRREYRERDETREDRLRLGYVNNGAIEGTIRLSYEHARRRGGEFDAFPTEAFRSAGLGPAPAAGTVAVASWVYDMAQFRSFDLADRDQDTLNARVNYAFLPTLDGAVSLQVKDADYPAEYGRTGRHGSRSLTFDLNYQFSPTSVAYGFYTWQSGKMAQKGVQPNSCMLSNTYYFYSNGQVLNAATGARAPTTPAGATLVATQDVTPGNWAGVCGSASATSPLFPDSRGWEVDSKDRGDVLGLGLKLDLGKAKLETDFTRTLGRTQIGYAYNPAALGMSAAQAGLAGSGFSDLAFAENVFNVSVLVPVTKTVSVRGLVRYETGKIRDWHYDGVAANPMPANNGAYLDAGPQDYRATTVGILFQVRM